MAHIRKCVVCKKEYEYCPHCGKFNPKTPWMVTFCSEDCKEILRICSSYRHGKMTKTQAKKLLKKVDLFEDVDAYASTISSALKELL